MAGPAPSKTSFPKTFSRWCPLLQHRNQNEGGYDGIRLKDKASKFREKHSTRERILRRSLFSKVLRRFPRMNKLMSLVRNGAGELGLKKTGRPDPECIGPVRSSFNILKSIVTFGFVFCAAHHAAPDGADAGADRRAFQTAP